MLSNIELYRNGVSNRKKILEYFTENPNNRVEHNFLIKDLFEKGYILKSIYDSAPYYWSEYYIPEVQEILREFCDFGFFEVITRCPGRLYSKTYYSLCVSKECVEKHIERCEKETDAI